MVGQLMLFGIGADVKPHNGDAALSHRGDPQTSREAATKLLESGKLTGQRKAVLEALSQCDGSTHAELGGAMGRDWLVAARRLPELARMGLVRKGEPRICRVKGSRCTTWWITEESDR